MIVRSAIRAPKVAALLLRLARGRPAVASVNLLNRCNQACPMCAVHEADDLALPLGELDRAFRALRRGGVRAVEVSGGEPFLRRDLPEVIELLDRAGLLYTVNTNGTATHAAGLAALARSRGLLQVAVSLDSLDRERYRFLRGRDLLDRALRGIDELRAADLPAPLKLNFAMSHHNAAEAMSVLAFAEERHLFLSVFPVNQGPGAHRSSGGPFAASSPQREDMATIFEGLAALRRRGAPLWEPSSFYLAAARFLRRESLDPCGAGRLFLDLRADGSVAPCVELPAIASLDDLVEGRAWASLEAAGPQARACRAATPCCYTCTVSLSETARRPARFALETTRVLLRARLRRRTGRRA